MKKLLLLSVLAIGIATTSCKKCADCSCTSSIEFEFTGFTTDEEQLIENETVAAYQEDYPDEDVELCEKRGDFEDAVSKYEGKTDIDTLRSGTPAKNYYYEWVRTCTCED